jgi:uncharacterized protein YegJ (DUF2314 family)
MWPLWTALALALLTAAIIAFVLYRRRKAQRSGRGGGNDFCSIILLRTAPRRLTRADVNAAARRAFPGQFDVFEPPKMDDRSNTWVISGENIPPVAVLDCRVPYIPDEEVEGVAANFESQPVRTALLGHRAWVAVDGVGSSGLDPEDQNIVHVFLARLAAEFLDDDTTLIHLKARGRFALPSPKAHQQLRDGALPELFGDDDLHNPMFNVDKEDPEINAAMAEAKRRIPEFLSAFEAAGPQPVNDDSPPFIFKARFPSGDGNEYIWLSLSAVTSSALVGTIENPPADPSIPAKGSKVKVKLDNVVDWAYARKGKEPVGMFVERILLKRAGR